MFINRQYSLAETVITILTERIKANCYSLGTTFVVGIMTYMFAFMHKLPNWDDVSLSGISWVGADHGRWMLNVVDLFMPDLSMPWIYGILSLMIQSIAICYILKLYDIHNRLFQCILSALIVSFPSLVGMMSYMFLSYSYSLSLLLAVLAAYYIKETSWKDVFSWQSLKALVCLVISMGFYQAYLGVTVSLLLVLIIRESLAEKYYIRKIVQRAIWFIFFIIIASICYYLINKLVFYIFSLELSPYAADKIETNQGFFERVYWLLINQVSMLLYGTYGFIPNIGSRIVHFVLFAFIVWALFIICVSKKQYGRLFFLLFLCCCLPFAINCIHFIAPTGTHSLTLLPFFSIYILVGILAHEVYTKNFFRVYDFICVLLFILVASNVLLANKNHLKQYIQYENAIAYWNRVLMRIESHSEFGENTKIAFVGNPKNRVTDLSQFGNDDITGIAHGNILDIYSRSIFIKTYIGFVSEYASQEEIEMIKHSQEFREMTIYPYDGSIEMIQNIMVVRFE